MQHAGLQYGQGAASSHQSPPFAHADISSVQQNSGGTTTSSLRQFRKKEGADKSSTAELNTSIETHIARVPPHNHFPARPNEHFRYQHQYPDYNSPFKETLAQVKYSEIAETPPQSVQHVDHMPAAIQKHKEVHKDYMDMCNISQQTHMKQNYPDSLTRQQNYPPDAASVHHQYLHKEPQVHPGYKPESQYQQYPQLSKYNMPSQCRKYPPPPPENDFLTKLQRINPSMARSIMSDHHIRESQTTYPAMDQSRMYPQNQRYYPPSHLQNNPYNYQPYNYPSSCNYKHPEYPRSNQMPVAGTQYSAINPHADRSISPRNLHMLHNYGTSSQKISPNYSQYNSPEYAQHYQHRRTSIPQDYYQQSCRTNPYVSGHQISPEPSDNRGGSSGGLRHFIENWAEEEATAEITPIFKENIRIHNNDSSNEQVFVISPSDIPQLENVSLVPTENGQFIIKSGTLDNSVVRIKETTETNGERTVNLQIVEATTKADCMLAEESAKSAEEPLTVPYQENQTANDCDDITKTTQPATDQEKEEETVEHIEEKEEKHEENTSETSVIVSNEISVIKDMPLIDEDHTKNEEEKTEVVLPQEEPFSEDTKKEVEITEDIDEDDQTSANKLTQRIFSVDDIINNVGSSPTHSRKNSLQLPSKENDEEHTEDKEPKNEDDTEEMEYRNAIISVEDDNVILEIGGAWVQLKINQVNDTKVLSVLPLSESLIIDANGNYQSDNEEEVISTDTKQIEDESRSEENPQTIDKDNEIKLDVPIEEEKLENVQDQETPAADHQSEHFEDINTSICQSEVVIGDEENQESEVILNLSSESQISRTEDLEGERNKLIESSRRRDDRKRSKSGDDRKKSSSKKSREYKEERKDSDERHKARKSSRDDITRSKSDQKVCTDLKKKDSSPCKKSEKKDAQEAAIKTRKIEKKLNKQNSVSEDEKKKERIAITMKREDRKIHDEEKNVKKTEESVDTREENNNKRDETKWRFSSSSEEDAKKDNLTRIGFEDERSNKSEKERENEVPQSSTGNEETLNESVRIKLDLKETEKPVTKAAKKLYITEPIKNPELKRNISKLEETVMKIKSMKEKRTEDETKTTIVERKSLKTAKKVTFNLETEVREINKEELDKKKLSWEEYSNRKKKQASMNESEEGKNKIMENTVTSTDDISDEVVEKVALDIENAMKDSVLRKSPPKMAPSNWEDDTLSPESPVKDGVMSTTTNRKCIIDVNEFNIKPIESISTPSPVSSSQISYHSEDDSLQVYKDVVDSKLNSLNIRIPKITKPKPVDRFSVLFDRFLNKGELNCEELKEVKKFIEIKRKMIEEEKKLTYEVRGERDYKDLKLHFRKVPEKRKKKRFRNLYAEDSSEDSESSRSDKGVGDYSVYQRDSQGVPKLIFKRKSGLPQPFVKLERSQAVELLAKKRKLY